MPAKFPDGSDLKRYAQAKFGAKNWTMVYVGADGLLAVVSHSFNFAHYFPHYAHADFREFLIALHPVSLLSIIEHADGYDGPSTAASIKRAIIAARRATEISKQDARIKWDALESFRVEHSQLGWLEWLKAMPDDSVSRFALTWNYSRAAVDFVQETWISFVEMLRRELAAEAKTRAILDALPPGDAGGNI